MIFAVFLSIANVSTKGTQEMTSKKVAHDASKLLSNKKSPPKVKEVAASDLAQTKPKKKS